MILDRTQIPASIATVEQLAVWAGTLLDNVTGTKQIKEQENSLFFEVRDTGSGLDEDELKKLLDDPNAS